MSDQAPTPTQIPPTGHPTRHRDTPAAGSAAPGASDAASSPAASASGQTTNKTLRDFSSGKLVDLSDASMSQADPEASTIDSITPPNASKMPKWLGKRVGRFRLVSLLGNGSWGKVFEAEDTNIRRRVALKLIAAVSQSGKPTADFNRVSSEARAAASLEHPNNISIYEVGRHGDFFFIAMELAEGGSIDEQLATGGPLDVPRGCTIAAEAADALAVAHECGIVHRDIKPGNLLLTRTGRCKLTDFGLAAGGNPSDPLHATRAAGTAHYVAPEVVRGHEADGRSDIYSLGFTLYHMLSGRRPFEGMNGRNDVLKAQLHKEPPPLEQVLPGVDPQLAAAVGKAMSKDPGQRFANAREFARVLRRFAVAVPGSASDASPPAASAAVPSKASALRQWWPALVGVAAILAIAIVIVLDSLGGGSQSSSAQANSLTDTNGTTAGGENPPTPPAIEPKGDPTPNETGSMFVATPDPTEQPVVTPPTEPAVDATLVTHTFSFDTRGWDSQPQSMCVVGDFNGWNQTIHRLSDDDGDRVWTIEVPVEPGVHYYKFLVDQETPAERWLEDPASDKSLDADDTYGGINSGVRIEAPADDG